MNEVSILVSGYLDRLAVFDGAKPEQTLFGGNRPSRKQGSSKVFD